MNRRGHCRAWCSSRRRQKRDQRDQDGSAEYDPDEVRTQAVTFNAMIDRAKKFRDSLETEVRECTAQLSRSNAKFLVSNPFIEFPV